MATVQGLNVGALNTTTASNSLGGTAAVRTGREILAGGNPKVGSAAGWVVNAAANIFEATMAASQTAGTLVVPLTGLTAGDTLTGFRVVAQVESAGGTVTIDADLRAETNVAADPTDASIGAITQVSVTADTAVSATKTGLTEVISVAKRYYLLITATTGSSCDIRYLASWCTVTTS
jgi:hypothetical protein